MKNLLQKTIAVASVLGLIALGVGAQALAATTLKYVETPAVQLYSSESSTAITMIITPVPVDLDGTALTMSDFGSNPTVTVDPGVSGYEEIESFTGLVNNGNNTATLTGLTRDYKSKYPYTTGTTGFQHGAGATVVFSNNPQLYNRLATLENDQTVTGITSFNIPPILNDTNATSTAQAASRAFVVGTAFGTTPVQVSAGGTGATSFPANTFLFYSGAGTALSASSSPMIGYLIATSTATSSIGGALNVNGTGTSTITGPAVVNGPLYSNSTTSLVANTAHQLYLNGVPMSFPSSQCTSGQTLTNNGSGAWSCTNITASRYTLATTTDITQDATGYATSTLLGVPANILTGSSTIEISGNASCANNGSGAGKSCDFFIRTGTGQQFDTFSIGNKDSTSGTTVGSFHYVISMINGAPTAQIAVGNITAVESGGATPAWVINESHEATTAFTLSSAFQLAFVLHQTDSTETPKLLNLSIVVNP